jgi:hypothetical protein
MSVVWRKTVVSLDICEQYIISQFQFKTLTESLSMYRVRKMAAIVFCDFCQL